MLANLNEKSVVMSLYDPVPTYPKESWFEPDFPEIFTHRGSKSRRLQTFFGRA